MKLSIITPVYNTSKYLRACVESVLKQSYKNWELWLLDDGSTDDSGAICDGYSLRDNRIKVVHKVNSGVSDTRNIGLDLANGDYIIFLDSDDYWIDHHILEKFVEHILEYNLDIVRAGFCEINDKDEIIKLDSEVANPMLESHVMTYLQYMETCVRRDYLTCVFMISKNALGCLRFNTERIFMEDAELYFRLFEKDLRCMYINECFYAYRKHDTAVTVRYNPRKYRDAFKLSKYCYDLSDNANDYRIRCFLINEGARIYTRYLQLLSLDAKVGSDLSKAYKEFGIHELKQMTRIRLSYLYDFSIRLICCLPLSIVPFVFRTGYFVKSFLRSLFNRISQ